MGGDCIPPVILKYAAATFAVPIHYLFSLCLSKSYLPAEWHYHCITPIFKCGDMSAVSNYRPISLLCSISKVLERLVFNKIYDFVAKFISISQFGFTRNHSSLQQLLFYSDFIVSAYDNHEQVDSIYLDIRKGFDTVPHAKLLFKLQDAGIIDNLWVFSKPISLT